MTKETVWRIYRVSELFAFGFDMRRNTLDYSASPEAARCRLCFRIVGVPALVLVVGTIFMWVRSYVTGDYVYLGKIYLSFARGYCRVVNGPWPFEPGYPVVGKPFVTYPLDKVGEYPLGSGASYVPLWLVALMFTVIGMWAYRRSNPRGRLPAT